MRYGLLVNMADVYDSYKLFSYMVSAGGAVCAGGDREAVGPRGTAAPTAEEQGTKHKRYTAV